MIRWSEGYGMVHGNEYMDTEEIRKRMLKLKRWYFGGMKRTRSENGGLKQKQCYPTALVTSHQSPGPQGSIRTQQVWF